MAPIGIIGTWREKLMVVKKNSLELMQFIFINVGSSSKIKPFRK
jgi:hypothetical protein